jgi:hypothetical protein
MKKEEDEKRMEWVSNGRRNGEENDEWRLEDMERNVRKIDMDDDEWRLIQEGTRNEVL